jgi:HEAT repeat protein
MMRPLKVDPAPDLVFLRIATQLTPLTLQEWSVLTSILGLLSPEAKIRIACWQAVERLVSEGMALSTLDIDILTVLWLGVHDDNEVVRAVAQSVWVDSVLLSVAFSKPLEALLLHPSKNVKDAAARAIAGLIRHLSTVDPQSSWTVIAQIQFLYEKNAPVRPTVLPLTNKLSSGGKGSLLLAPLIKKPSEDLTVGLRIAVAQTFLAVGVQKAISVESDTILCDLISFILQKGVIDLHVDVRAAMLLAGKSLIDCHGRELCGVLQRLLEEVLANKHLPHEDATDFDNRHSAAVVLLGATGRHLEKGNPSILVIADSLVQALKTPSEAVQRAVADCLAPLLQIMKGTERADELLEALLATVLEGNSYGDRRGAAFGLSAVIKGLGIPSLKQHDVVTRLKEACTNGSINSRQGSLFAFECLSERLGLLFEPYIIVVVPIMLKSFSHSSEHVRDAAQGAAMVIMSRLSAHGVKQVLTPILTTLPVEPAWKSRQEAIRLLGMMAHCAPKQLAACLPQIVTCLVDAGSSDPHPKVKESAKAAMTDISSVIRNPEVARLSPVLLVALADPANRTKEALEALLECEFMHSIDAPSLALLVPILGRALRDRGADLKRKAAAITGNIMTMVSEPSALAPYLPQVLPGLKDCLMDPIPDVRASSAKALGSLFAGVGEDQLCDLVPWLIASLRSEVSPVERSGAAQGLSEICGHAMGPVRVEQILLLVLRMKEEVQSAPREGLLWFLSFLPMTLNEGFAPYISVSLPVILSGLSDDNDGVREVAMRAGQVVVSKLGLNHTLKLLPSLADGMFHDDWRIRQSSVKLLGELLYLVGDTKAVGLADGEDDDDEMGAGNGTGGSTSRVAITIRAHIGEKHTNEVLASLYIVRSDVATAVRQSALQIWKSIVSNTPRTLVEIMPILVLQLIAKLSSDSEELRLVSGRALGELVRKLGDRVLPVIVPHIRQGLRSAHESMRQGACSGLSEILTACTKKQAEDYIEVLMPALRQALCDVSNNVCVQAAQSFMTLFKTVGAQAIDEVVPALLDTLASGSEEAEFALRGLREIVQMRPRDLVEYLLPTLLTSPMEYVSARALGSVAEVAGLQFNYHFQTLIPGLVHELYGATDKMEKLKVRLELETESAADEVDDLAGELSYETERFEAIKEAAAAVMASVTSSGVHLLISELGKQIEHETNIKRRRWGCWLAQQFVSRSKADYEDYVPLLLKFILSRVAELDKVLLQAVSDCLLAISVSLPLDELAEHMSFICSCISSAASAARHRTGTSKLLTVSGEFLLPLLTLPKSFDPLLNIALYGLMNGSANVRAACAEAIGELAIMTDATVLKPVLIKTTGPLIRVIGDRYPSNVKAAILQVLLVSY